MTSPATVVPVGLRWLARGRAAALALVFMAGASLSAPPPHTRVALVIGNGAYAGPAALVNPVRDAQAMAATLRRLGFTVVEVQDASKGQMLAAVRQAAQMLKDKQGLGLFYYAGHGLQMDWRNYMVPVDARLAAPGDVASQTVDVDAVVQSFKDAGNRMNIVILDACRDYPFAAKPAGRGLAPMDAPPGTLLAYATAPGNVAEDGDPAQGNGLYTRFLLKEMVAPARIEDVFKRVRLHVRQHSQGRQIPWESTSLEEDFSFNGDGIGDIRRAARAPTADREFARQKAEWDRIKGSRRPEDFYAYLQRYPQGYIAEQASFMLEQLAARATTSVADRYGQRQDPRQARFRVGDVHATRTLDTRSGREISRNTQRVESIRGGRVYLKGTNGDAVRTMDGGYVSGTNLEGAYRWDPPRLDLPGGEMAVGKRWKGRTIETSLHTGRTHTRDDEVKIVAQEEVTVPAGRFVAYKFVLESRLSNGVRARRTYWAQPGWAQYIKVEREIFRPNQPPQLETIEMVSRSFGK